MKKKIFAVIVWLWCALPSLAQLPVRVVVDRYLLQAEELMAAGDYPAAQDMMDRIRALQEEHGLTLPAEFQFRFAQGALGMGSVQDSMEAITRYLSAVGREDRFYRDALKLFDRTESMQTRLARIEQLEKAADYDRALKLMAEIEALYEELAIPAPEKHHSRYWKIQRAKESCTNQPEARECWVEFSNPRGCHYWGSTGTVDTWTGECLYGLAHGPGTLAMTHDMEGESFSVEHTGSFKFGRAHGLFVDRYTGGVDSEGSYEEGFRTGKWIERDADRTVREGPYVKSQRHGKWVIRHPDGRVDEGPYVEGKQHGKWVFRFKDETNWEGQVVDGVMHGDWVLHLKNGLTQKGRFVEGLMHGHWSVYNTNGIRIADGPMVKGKKHGKWNESFAHGRTETGPYVEGKRHGRWGLSYYPGGKYRGEVQFSESGLYWHGEKHGSWRIYRDVYNLVGFGNKRIRWDVYEHGTKVKEGKWQK